MLASEVVNRASRILFDNTNVRWPVEELLDYTSDGEREVILHRPDANAVNQRVQLVGGSKQTIPANGARLLRVVRNSGTVEGSNVPGVAIREAHRDAMDNENPNWHLETGRLPTRHFIYDQIDPKTYYVYPPAPGALGSSAPAFIDIVHLAIPPAITTVGQTMTLTDQYLNPILDWVLYRAYIKDASYAGNMGRAQVHIQNFANSLQIPMTIQWAASVSSDRAREMASSMQAPKL